MKREIRHGILQQRLILFFYDHEICVYVQITHLTVTLQPSFENAKGR